MTEKEQKELQEEKEPKKAKKKKEAEDKKGSEEAKESEKAKEPEEKREAKEKEVPKEKKEPKVKPLDRMTAKELREMALGIEGIVGVHAMNKSELVAAIKKAKGIVEEKKRDTSVDVRSIKKKIRELRTQKEAMREAGEKDQVRVLRRRISRLKKRSRRAAKAAA